jgi:fructokinase
MNPEGDDPSRTRTMDQPPVAVVGEALFDCFPDGTRVLGGAPFNVAWHLAGFGLTPRFISRVGDDAGGREMRRVMREWGLDDHDLQVDPSAGTGEVQVHESAGGEPGYTIAPDQAFDRIAPDLDPPLTDATVLYHGSLALRDRRTRASVEACVASAGSVFVDCNLRAPWWTEEVLATAVRRARWVKLNAEELTIVARAFGVAVEGRSLIEQAHGMRRAAELDEVIVTAGEAGALVVDSTLAIETPTPPARVVDTVGAGDGFSAVVLAGILQGWSARTRLERAVAFAARVCGVRGALIRNRETYAECVAAWSEEGVDHG